MRKKRIYTLQVPKRLEEIDFPTRFKGRNSVKKTINEFVKENKEALIGIYHPNDEELDDVGRMVDHVTWRERCTKEAQGYEYYYDKGCDVGTFSKGVWHTDEEKTLGNLITRAKDGNLTDKDFLGYTHSLLRYNFDRVASAVINKATDKLIRNRTFFKLVPLFKGKEKIENIVEFGITMDLWHHILDDIIMESDEIDLKDPMQAMFFDNTEKHQDLMQQLERKEIDMEEYKEESFCLRKKLFNRLFEYNSTYRERAAAVDRVRNYDWKSINCSFKSKSIRLTFCLVDKGLEPTSNENKEEVILVYYDQHPKISLRKAAKALGISVNTIRKYKPTI